MKFTSRDAVPAQSAIGEPRGSTAGGRIRHSTANPMQGTPAPSDAGYVRAEPARLVYCAAPLSTFATPYYAALVAVCRAHFPDYRVYSPADELRSTKQWLREWPRQLANIAVLAFITDDAGRVGAGVYREVRDAAARGIPILFFDGIRFHPIPEPRFTDMDRRDSRSFARLDWPPRDSGERV